MSSWAVKTGICSKMAEGECSYRALVVVGLEFLHISVSLKQNENEKKLTV